MFSTMREYSMWIDPRLHAYNSVCMYVKYVAIIVIILQLIVRTCLVKKKEKKSMGGE